MNNPKTKHNYDEKINLFDFAAEAGFTKPKGSIETTQVVIEFCTINSGKHLLDIGCGVGIMPVIQQK